MKLNQLLISTAVLGATFGAGSLLHQTNVHADTLNQNNVPTQSAANVTAGVSSTPQSQAPASAPQSSAPVATQSAPQSVSQAPVQSAPATTVTTQSSNNVPQSVSTSASNEVTTSASAEAPATSSYDYSNNIPPQSTIKVAHVVKTHRTHNYYDQQISNANANMSSLINNIPTYGATHRSSKHRNVVTPKVSTNVNTQSHQTVDTSNIQNNIPTNTTTTTTPQSNHPASTQGQSQLSESGYPTLPAGVSPSAYNWTDARTEAGQSPWETTSQGVSVHQTLHNGNQIYYNNAGTGVDYQAFNDAVNNWNRLGVIQLVPTDAANAQITLSNDDDPQDDGHSDYGITYGYSNDDGTMYGYHSYLDRATDNTSYQEKVNTATHELGHSLGFAHDMSRYYDEAGSGHFSNHIMMSGQTDATLPLSTKEANALRAHYGL